MNTLEVILSRRSIRKYTDETISDAQLELILAAGLAAASGRGIHPVELVVVRDKETIETLKSSRAIGAGMLADASACIVTIAKVGKSDTWIEDGSLAMGNMMLMATELGIGSCWVHGRERVAKDKRSTEEFVFDLLGIEGSYKLVAMLSLGMPAEQPAPYEINTLDWSKVRNFQ